MNVKQEDLISERERWERRFKSRAIPKIKLELFDDPEELEALVQQSQPSAYVEDEEDPEVDAEAEELDSQVSKRQKLRTVKPEEGGLVAECVEITNRLASEHQRDKAAFETRTMDQLLSSTQRLGPPRRLDFHTNFQPMEQLRRTYVHEPAAKRSSDASMLTANPGHGRNEITGNSFGANSIEELLEKLFSKDIQYHNMRSEKQGEPLQGYVKPVDSPGFIQKLLVVPRSPFRECLNKSLGLCEAARDPKLRHPLDPGAGCQAYCSQDEYRSFYTTMKYGNQVNQDNVRPDVCEFCYRFSVAKQVLAIVNNNHRSATEVASRLHQAGLKGGYSLEGCHQPTVKSNTAYTDGVIGHVRTYSTADYLPVMLRFNTEGDVAQIKSIADWQKLGLTMESPGGWVCGWQEVKWIQNLNCNALLTVPQINPYKIAIPVNGDQLSVEGILRVFCEQRRISCRLQLPKDQAVNVFTDLRECIIDPAYLDNLKTDEFLHWRPHGPGDSPSPVSEHRIYYCLLVKVNALREWTSPGAGRGISKAMLQKMRVYLSQHHALMDFIDTHKIFSDNELLKPVFADPATGLPTSALYVNWPWPRQHFRSGDYVFSRPGVTVYSRPNPEQYCKDYYVEQPVRILGTLPYRLELRLNPIYPPDYQLKQALAQLAEVRRKFTENRDSLDYFDCSGMHWDDPVANWNDPDSPKMLQLLHKAVAENYARQLAYLEKKQSRYEYLLCTYGPHVLCPFDDTYDVIQKLSIEQLTELVREFGCFVKQLPDSAPSRIGITETRVGRRTWNEHRVLVSALLRVAVLEELHELEPISNNEIRFNLRLLSGSHVKLVSKILSDPRDLDTDAELLANSATLQNRAGSLYALYYPYSEREVHEGCLPDYINSLAKVDFFADTGMDSYAFNKIFYKLPDRACDTRELSEVLVQHCKNSPSFYNYICLLLEVSFKGNYRHCSVAATFSRKIVLEELFVNNRRVMKVAIQQLIMDNQSMIADALSEALCFMIDYAPALKEMLLELYKDWFSWRVYINMDMVRHCFNTDGNFDRARLVVYKRIDLKVTRSIYRQKESDFVVWLAMLIKKANEERYKEVAKTNKGLPLAAYLMEEDRKIDDDTRVMVRLFVRALPPQAVIEVKDLKLIGLTRETLKKMNELHDCFTAQNQPGSRGTDARYLFPEKALFKILNDIDKSQYAILHHFVTILQNYQSIQSTRIDNYDILNQQCARLEEISRGLGLEHVPADLTRFCFTPFCCNSIKTTLPTRVDTEAYGHEEIAYDHIGQFYACSKHKFQPNAKKDESKTMDEPVPEAKGDERIKAKMQRQVEREDQKPKCKDAEICFYDALGEVINTDGVKVPRSKKNQKADIKKLPCSSWWITPCCGKRYSYDFWCWNDSVYSCGTCQRGNDVALSYQTLICENCLEPVLDIKQHDVLRVYDDEEMQCFRNMVACKKCVGYWKRLMPQVILKSQMRKVASDENYLTWISGGDLAVSISHLNRKRKK
jgi:hypothetical protein